MEHRLTLQHSLNAIDIEIVFVEGQKRKLKQIDLIGNWGQIRLIGASCTTYFCIQLIYSLRQNISTLFENNNWMGYWGQTKLIGACGLPPAQHKHLKYQIKGKTQTHIHKHKHTHTQKYICTQIYAIIMQHWLQELL